MTSQTCKICSGTDFRFIGKPRISPVFPRSVKNHYTIQACNHCGFYFIDPPIDLSQEEWTSLYENNYFGGGSTSKWYARVRCRELKKRMEYITANLKTEKGRFLDIGCGQGSMLIEAGMNGLEPYGVDIADNLLPELKGNCNFFKGDIRDARYPDEHFSVIYMDSVLEHIPDPRATLEELTRILKPGGVMLLIVPNEDSLMNSFIRLCYTVTLNEKKYGKIKPFFNPYHINGFNRRSLECLLRMMKTEIIMIKTFGGTYTFWKAQKPFSKQYFIELFSYPVGLMSVMTGGQIQLMALVSKNGK